MWGIIYILYSYYYFRWGQKYYKKFGDIDFILYLCEMKKLIEFVINNAANILYIVGSLCFLIGTLINMYKNLK